MLNFNYEAYVYKYSDGRYLIEKIGKLPCGKIAQTYSLTSSILEATKYKYRKNNIHNLLKVSDRNALLKDCKCITVKVIQKFGCMDEVRVI